MLQILMNGILSRRSLQGALFANLAVIVMSCVVFIVWEGESLVPRNAVLLSVAGTVFVVGPAAALMHVRGRYSYKIFMRDIALCLCGVILTCFIAYFSGHLDMARILLGGLLALPVAQFMGAVYWQVAVRPDDRPWEWFWVCVWGGLSLVAAHYKVLFMIYVVYSAFKSLARQ